MWLSACVRDHCVSLSPGTAIWFRMFLLAYCDVVSCHCRYRAKCGQVLSNSRAGRCHARAGCPLTSKHGPRRREGAKQLAVSTWLQLAVVWHMGAFAGFGVEYTTIPCAHIHGHREAVETNHSRAPANADPASVPSHHTACALRPVRGTHGAVRCLHTLLPVPPWSRHHIVVPHAGPRTSTAMPDWPSTTTWGFGAAATKMTCDDNLTSCRMQC